MSSSRQTTKIFAFIFLFFASLINAESQDSIYRLEAGTTIRVSMDSEINSEAASVNDTFTTTIAEAVKVRDAVVLPVGTVIEGRVTKVKRAAGGGKSGMLAVMFETIRFESGEKRSIEGILLNELQAESSSKTNILAIIGSAGLGALLGAVSKTKNGALVGAGIGAGAGTGVALLRKGKNVRLKTDEKFDIKLTKQVTLPVLDY